MMATCLVPMIENKFEVVPLAAGNVPSLIVSDSFSTDFERETARRLKDGL